MRTPEEQASYIDSLETKIGEREVQITDLKAEIERLKKEKGISGPREGLTFSDHTGIWSDQSGRFYCPTCLDSDKRNPLKVETHGWRCTAGNHYFYNPDDPPPMTMRLHR